MSESLSPDELTDLLSRATEDSSLRPAFLSALLHSTVFFCASSDALSDSTFSANGQTFRLHDERQNLSFIELRGRNGQTIPFWTSLDELEQDLHRLKLGEQPYMTLTGLGFLEATLGRFVVLNPGTFAREFSPQQTENLIERGHAELAELGDYEDADDFGAQEAVDELPEEYEISQEVEQEETVDEEVHFEEDDFQAYLRQQSQAEPEAQTEPEPFLSAVPDPEPESAEDEEPNPFDFLMSQPEPVAANPFEPEVTVEDEAPNPFEPEEEPEAEPTPEPEQEPEQEPEPQPTAKQPSTPMPKEPAPPARVPRSAKAENVFVNVPDAVSLVTLLLHGRSDEAWTMLETAKQKGSEEGLSKALALLLFTVVDGMGTDDDKAKATGRLKDSSNFWNEWIQWVSEQDSPPNVTPEILHDLSTQTCGCGHSAALHGRYSWPLRDMGIQTTSPCDARYCVCEGFFQES